jgi:hypothetical protein
MYCIDREDFCAIFVVSLRRVAQGSRYRNVRELSAR